MTTQPPPATTEPGDDAPTQETNIGLVDLIKRKLAQEQQRKVYGSPADEMMLAYMYCAANAESYEQRRLDAEHLSLCASERELAALRARLETAETALRRIRDLNWAEKSVWIDDARYFAETALVPPSRAEGGAEGGETA